MNPAKAIKNLICALHALLYDTPLNRATWLAAKENPEITSGEISSDSLNLDNLSNTRLMAIKAGARYAN